MSIDRIVAFLRLASEIQNSTSVRIREQKGLSLLTEVATAPRLPRQRDKNGDFDGVFVVL